MSNQRQNSKKRRESQEVQAAKLNLIANITKLVASIIEIVSKLLN